MLFSISGVVLLLISATLYHLQRSSALFQKIRPFVIAVNLLTFIWFALLQLSRFHDAGRACAGEFLKEIPGNYGSIYLPEQANWIKWYVVSQYLVYFASKIVSIIITNKLEAEFDEQRNMVMQKV